MIPHEAAVEGTHISFNKGCYTGQEIVERVRSRGQVNRKRVSLKFSTAEPPAAGTKLRAGGNDIGYVTSSAFSPGSTALQSGWVICGANTTPSEASWNLMAVPRK